MMSSSGDDQKMLMEVSAVGDKYPVLSIYDCRPQLNAQANRVKGGGFESMDDYTNCEFAFCGIDNIHAVTNVFNKLFDIAQNP